MVCFDGRDLEHFENRLVALELVKQDLTRAIMFDKMAKWHKHQTSYMGILLLPKEVPIVP